MNTDENNSNAINATDDLDAFSADFFGTNPNAPEPVQIEAPDADADNTSPSDADDTNEQPDNEADSDSNEEEDELPEEEEEIVEKPKKKTAQERISEVIGERNAARAALDELRAQLEELKAPKPVEKKEPEAPSVAPTGAPDPNAVDENGEAVYPLGEYDTKFLEDRVNWLFANKEAEQERKRAEQEALNRQQAELAALQTGWKAKLEAAEKTEEMAGIRDKGMAMLQELDSLMDEKHGEFIGKTIMGMEKGVEVFNFLANNLDIARHLATLDTVNATITLGAIQERVGKREGNNVNTRVSKAPEPPKITSRGSNGRFETPDDTEDLDAFSSKFFVKRR